MKKKNLKIDKDHTLSSVEFCVECKWLQNYSMMNDPFESARQRFENCCKTKKFNGDYCSRIFINEFQPDNLPDEFQNSDFPDL